MDLTSSLRPDHFAELEEIKRGQPFADVPLWLSSPVISEQECQHVARAVESLGRELLELGLEERRRGREQQWLPSLPGLLESIGSQPAETDPAFHWRFDFLWDRKTGQLAFLELNAGDPSGLGWVDAFTQAMRRHSLWAQPLRSELTAFDLAGSHQRALEEVFSGRPKRLGFAAARDSTVRSDIICWAQRYRDAGYDVVVADPREYVARDSGLYWQEQRIDALIRDTYEELYWPPFEGIGQAWGALVARGRLLLVNPLCATFWDSKALWSLLQGWPTVPETRRLTGPVSDPEGWVLKPIFDYGGRGVLCGAACSRTEWDSAMKAALSSPSDWVLQRQVPFSIDLFPRLDGRGEIVWDECYLTWSAFLDRGRFSGIMARAGKSPVVNVHNGGAIFPVYVARTTVGQD